VRRWSKQECEEEWTEKVSIRELRGELVKSMDALPEVWIGVGG